MSWRLLELAEQPSTSTPQLLVKPAFTAQSYTLHVTCLTNIWSEHLDLAAIVNRATEQQSPIEVSTRDTVQLAILLDNVKNSLDSSHNAECRVTRNGTDGITLHTVIRLPAPLDSLNWKFHLQKRSSVTLKNELILPLLVSSHIQYERINDLVTIIENKDKALTRMLDQFESSNLHLAAAFPSIGGLKSGRSTVKREQAARHVPALRPFKQDVWREETAQLIDSDLTTLGLFQEALLQCMPDVPSTLEAHEGAEDWLSAVPSRLSYATPAVKIITRSSAPAFQPPKHGHESSPVDDDTEDEFEVHDNFKTRHIPEKRISTAVSVHANAEDESTDDEGDLDAPSKTHSQNQSQAQNLPSIQPAQRTRSLSPKSSEPATSPSPISKPKGKAFRIGGKAKKPPPSPPLKGDLSIHEDPSDQPFILSNPGPAASPRKLRKPFKIGGRQPPTSSLPFAASPPTNRPSDAHSPTPKSSPPPIPHIEKEVIPVRDVHEEEVHEETPEEKAERKRAELKRRNEEAIKKQALHKRKKRF